LLAAAGLAKKQLAWKRAKPVFRAISLAQN